MREDIVSNIAAASGAAPGAASLANGEADVPPWAQFSPGRGRFVRFVIVCCIALTLVAAALIYWRWANVYEPTSYIMVFGNESHNGTVIVVSAPDFPDSMATLSRDNNYTAAIFLHPGTYTITATLNGQPLARSLFTVTGRIGKTLNLVPQQGKGAAPPKAA